MILEAFATALLHSLWQLTGIGAATAVLMHGQSGARHRYATGVLGLCAMAWAPIATTTWLLAQPQISNGFVGSGPTTAAPSWPLWLVGAWTLGVLFTGGRSLLDLVRIETLHRSGIAAPPELQRSFDRLVERIGAPAIAQLRLVPREMTPVAIGFFKPTVLLPAALLTRLTPSQIEAVLAHELVHLKRLDYAVNLVQSALDAALFYHPAARWLSARVRDEREAATDAEVVDVLSDRVTYARALTELEAWRLDTLTAAPAATGGRLMDRIQRILGRPAPSRRPRWALPGLAIAGLAAFATTAAIAQDVTVSGDADVEWSIEGNELVLHIDGRDLRVPLLSEDQQTHVDVEDDGEVQVIDVETTTGSVDGESQRSVHIVEVRPRADAPEAPPVEWRRHERHLAPAPPAPPVAPRAHRAPAPPAPPATDAHVGTHGEAFVLDGDGEIIVLRGLPGLEGLEGLSALEGLQELEALGSLESLKSLESLGELGELGAWEFHSEDGNTILELGGHPGEVIILDGDGDAQVMDERVQQAIDEAMRALDGVFEDFDTDLHRQIEEEIRRAEETERRRAEAVRRDEASARRHRERRYRGDVQDTEAQMREAEARLREAERELERAREELRRAVERGETVEL